MSLESAILQRVWSSVTNQCHSPVAVPLRTRVKENKTKKKWSILPEDTHLVTHCVAQEEEGGRKANFGIKSELPQVLTFRVGEKKKRGGPRGERYV